MTEKSTRKKHGNTGNRSAAKPDPKNARLFFRCHIEDMERWQRAADSANLKLQAWAITTLNAAAIKR